MATIAVYALGGLDQKSNDLTRATDKASQMQNMEYDTQSTIKKRTGYDVDVTYSNADMIYYQNTNERLLFNNNSNTVRIYKSDNTYRDIVMPYTVGTADISSTENQSNLYFTSTDLSIPVMKYDGSNIYRAGLPRPRALIDSYGNDNAPVISGTSGTYSVRAWYEFKDINGNVTASPYYQYDAVSASASYIEVQTFKDQAGQLMTGYNNKYCMLPNNVFPATYTYTIDSLNRTITVLSHNYEVGESILIERTDLSYRNGTNPLDIEISSNKQYKILKIESKTSTSITFTSSSIGSDTITITNIQNGTIYPNAELSWSKCVLKLAVSTTSGYGYRIPIISASYYTIYNNLNTQTFRILYNTTGIPTSLEDVYDTTTLKLSPPYCKYIGSYGNQIIYGNIGLFFNEDNTSVNYDNDDLIVFSDLSTNDGPENVSPINFQKIGETWDGSITGMRRSNDSFVIFKSHGVFSIDGAILPSQYQLRKINTNYVGCTSDKSILDAEDGLYFQAHNGIYYTNGISVRKISYELDSYFGSENYNLTRSVRYKEKQKALFYVNGAGLSNQKIVVVDYYYGQVYFWTGIDASKGFIEDKDGNVYFTNGSVINKFNSSVFHDGANPIDAYYSTTYHHCGVPALRKKFLAIRVFALTSDAFTMTITHDTDWGTSTAPSHTLTFASSDQTKRLVHDMTTVRSQRYTFRNAVIDEPMVITGYEITWEPYEQQDKN